MRTIKESVFFLFGVFVFGACMGHVEQTPYASFDTEFPESREGDSDNIDSDNIDSDTVETQCTDTQMPLSRCTYQTVKVRNGRGVLLDTGNWLKRFTVDENDIDVTDVGIQAEHYCITPLGDIWAVEGNRVHWIADGSVTHVHTIEDSSDGLMPHVNSIECPSDEALLIGGRYSHGNWDGEEPPPSRSLLLHARPEKISSYESIDDFDILALKEDNGFVHAGGSNGGFATYWAPDLFEFFPLTNVPVDEPYMADIVAIAGWLPDNLYVATRAMGVIQHNLSWESTWFSDLEYPFQTQLAMVGSELYAASKEGTADGFALSDTSPNHLYKLQGEIFSSVVQAADTGIRNIDADGNSLFVIPLQAGENLLVLNNDFQWRTIIQNQNSCGCGF